MGRPKKKASEKVVRIAVYVSPAVHKALAKRARATGRTVERYCKGALDKLAESLMSPAPSA